MKITSFLKLVLATSSIISCSSYACQNYLNKDLKICDDNKDLVADDTDKKNSITPKTLNIAFATIEDTSFYEQVYGEFINSLQKCMKMPVLVYPIYNEKNVIEAMKTDKVHVASFGAGATMNAVNQAGAIPFAGRGKNGENEAYQLYLITRSKDNYKKISDLRGKKIAHATPTSVSGNLAPKALFPELGLIPDIDYKVEFSGRHDKSILGIKNGFYDGAAVASDVFNRMVYNKEIDKSEFTIIWKSNNFPTNGFSYNYKLSQPIKKNIQECFYKYKFSDKSSALLNGNNEFVRINYLKDWDLVRKVAQKAKK